MLSTLQIGDSQYLLDHSKPAAYVSEFDALPDEYTPVTLVHHDHGKNLEQVLSSFRSDDDVWTEHFLKVLIFQSTGCMAAKNLAFESKIIILDQTHPIVAQRRKITLVQSHPILGQGPYVLHSPSGNVYPVVKLYKDKQNAFIGGILPLDKRGVHKWSGSVDGMPVPSRLRSKYQTGPQLLRGMRFGVKDSIDISGLESGCGNSSWREHYGRAKETAPFVEQLIKAGGHLVGKTRLVSFGDGLDPLEITSEIVPINPRGDGHQKPSGSSSGSAAACASYPWLDFTVGTDTGGSIRHPAAVNGLYGMRPSLGTVQSKGFVCSSSLDTVGIFARSPAILQLAMECIMADTLTARLWHHERIRFRLIYVTEPETRLYGPSPKFFPFSADDPMNMSEAGRCFEDVILKLEAYFGRKRQQVCLYELWKESHPIGMSDDLVKATGAIYERIVYRDIYRNNVQPFELAYRARNEGRAPFIEAVTQVRLEQGSKVTDAEYHDAVRSKSIYASWVNETLLPSPFKSDAQNDPDTETLEIPLLVYPQSWGVPQYRDESMTRDDDTALKGFSVYSISYCSGCPDVTVPIGEVKFNSRITGKNAYLPVSMSILAPRGADRILLELLSRLEAENILKSVICGPRTFAS